MNVAGLFAGIGGLELGLSRAGHDCRLLVEIDPAASRVLERRFAIGRESDVRALASLPAATDLIAAGFPCQDLSQAGRTVGIRGGRSSLVGEVFRLARQSRVPWILLENVPFMLSLRRGEAIRLVVGELEELGYRWAYRTVDTRAFGLPQRRERVFLLASRIEHPARILFRSAREPVIPASHEGLGCGFYWTEGTRGLGWAVDAVPTLKGGSAVGIPSPPAIWIPGRGFFTPDLRDAERMQGFEPDWTLPAEEVTRAGYRWKLVGNAVSVPVAEWIGRALAAGPGGLPELRGIGAGWPPFACGERGLRQAVVSTTWPESQPAPPLAEFLRYAPKPLSTRAGRGFLGRLRGSSLRHPAEFREALEASFSSQIR